MLTGYYIDPEVVRLINQAHTETDNSFEKQVLRAMNKLHYEGRYVGNPMLASCAEIMLAENPGASNPDECSAGRHSYAYSVPARSFPKRNSPTK